MLRVLLRSITLSAALVLPLQGQDGNETQRTDRLSVALTAPAPTAQDLTFALEVLDRSQALLDQGEYLEAAEGMGALSDLVPTLSDWIPLFQAEIAAETGDPIRVQEYLDALPSDSEVRAGWGWLAEARALEMAGEPGEAASVVRAAAARLPSGADFSLVWLRVGELEVLAEQEGRAREAFARAINASHRSRSGIAAADGLSTLDGLSPDQHYAVARVRVAQAEWRKAIPGLKAGKDLPGLSQEERSQSQLDLGRAYFSTDQYGSARTVFEAVLQDSASTDPVAARALYYVGRSTYRQGRRDEGRLTLESVAERYPETRASGDALYLLADLDHDAGRMEDAERYYAQILDVTPRSTTADLAGMRLGSLRYMDSDLTSAATVFDRRRQEAGSLAGRQQASFWAALVYEASGQPDLAMARFREAYDADPLSYYGTQAAARVDEPLLSTTIPAGPETPAARELAGPLQNAVARLIVHAKVPTPGSFNFELDRLKAHFRTYQGGEYSLAEALIEGGLPIQGIVAGREIRRATSEWDLRALRIVYPFPYRSVILREAERRQVNPYLAAGLIRQESMFDEDIKSRAGAIGMMQVMPATGKELARGVGITPYSTIRLTEAEVNVILGMTFLSEMLHRYDGAVIDALVAYNAGPTRIRRWRGMPEYKDQNLFTERIPFRETREYVKVVQKNALIYESLYGCGGGEQPCLGTSPKQVRGLVGLPKRATQDELR